MLSFKLEQKDHCGSLMLSKCKNTAKIFCIKTDFLGGKIRKWIIDGTFGHKKANSSFFLLLFFLGGGASSAQIVLINLFFMMIMSAQACSPLLCLHKQQWPA